MLFLVCLALAWEAWAALSLWAAWHAKFGSIFGFIGSSFVLAVALAVWAQWHVNHPSENLATRAEVQGATIAILRIASAAFAAFGAWVAFACLLVRAISRNASSSPWTGYQITVAFVAGSLLVAGITAQVVLSRAPNLEGNAFPPSWSRLVEPAGLSFAVSIVILAVLIGVGALVARFVFDR
jgi:hypothetical protein